MCGGFSVAPTIKTPPDARLALSVLLLVFCCDNSCASPLFNLFLCVCFFSVSYSAKVRPLWLACFIISLIVLLLGLLFCFAYIPSVFDLCFVFLFSFMPPIFTTSCFSFLLPSLLDVFFIIFSSLLPGIKQCVSPLIYRCMYVFLLWILLPCPMYCIAWCAPLNSCLAYELYLFISLFTLRTLRHVTPNLIFSWLFISACYRYFTSSWKCFRFRFCMHFD